MKNMVVVGIFNITLLMLVIAYTVIFKAQINDEEVVKLVDSIEVCTPLPTPLVSEVIGTMYHCVAGQCDSDPLITADNSLISLEKLKKGDLKWVALSRDLLKRWGGPYSYGDTLYVYDTDSVIKGMWYVHDTMNKRYRKRIDFLVDTSNKTFPHIRRSILISNEQFYTGR